MQEYTAQIRSWQEVMDLAREVLKKRSTISVKIENSIDHMYTITVYAMS